MAAKKSSRRKNGRAEGPWRTQTVIVKKSHPFARSKDEAVLVAERHAKAPARGSDSTNGAYRVSIRPKTCFREFRGQRRGPHVTVYWGELRADMRARPECR